MLIFTICSHYIVVAVRVGWAWKGSKSSMVWCVLIAMWCVFIAVWMSMEGFEVLKRVPQMATLSVGWMASLCKPIKVFAHFDSSLVVQL